MIPFWLLWMKKKCQSSSTWWTQPAKNLDFISMHQKRKSKSWPKCLPISSALSEYEKFNTVVYVGSIIEVDGGSWQKYSAEWFWANQLWPDCVTSHVITKSLERLGRDLYNHLFSLFSYMANDKRRIDAFEMWARWRMLRISWTARQTNISILNKGQVFYVRGVF